MLEWKQLGMASADPNKICTRVHFAYSHNRQATSNFRRSKMADPTFSPTVPCVENHDNTTKVIAYIIPTIKYINC